MANPPETIEYLGKRNFKEFVTRISRLLSVEEFDAIVGAGNSGLGMAKFTQMIYEEMGLIPPPVIPIVITRKQNPITKQFECSFVSSKDEVLPFLPQKFPNGTLLFVDDEVGKGRIAEASMELISLSTGSDFRWFVAAESHGYDPLLRNPNFNITFIPFGQKHEGLYGVIYHVMRSDIAQKLQILINAKEGMKALTNLLLGLPIKEQIGSNWKFINKYSNIRMQNREFKILQAEYIRMVRQLIRESLFKKPEEEPLVYFQ